MMSIDMVKPVSVSSQCSMFRKNDVANSVAFHGERNGHRRHGYCDGRREEKKGSRRTTRKERRGSALAGGGGGESNSVADPFTLLLFAFGLVDLFVSSPA